MKDWPMTAEDVYVKIEYGRDAEGFADRTLVPADLARVQNMALRESAEALHDLSEDPEHIRHVFAECPNWRCRDARTALARYEQEVGDE